MVMKIAQTKSMFNLTQDIRDLMPCFFAGHDGQCQYLGLIYSLPFFKTILHKAHLLLKLLQNAPREHICNIRLKNTMLDKVVIRKVGGGSGSPSIDARLT